MKNHSNMKNQNQCIPCPPRAPAADVKAGKEEPPPEEAKAKA